MPPTAMQSPLLDPNLPATAKVVWLALRSCGPTASPADLERRSGLSRPTVQQGLAQLKSQPTGPSPEFPADLLSDKRIGAPAKVVYGLLQMSPTGDFTYPQLSSDSGMAPNTVKRALRTQQDLGWVKIKSGRKFAPIHFTLLNPVEDRRQAEVAQADERLKGACRGEKLIREYLSLLIDSDDYEDNATPGFLINPLTGKEMQYDRYYFRAKVAFEFQGSQHSGPTERYPSKKGARRQQARDLIKFAISTKEGITLVYVHFHDLTLPRMRRKVGDLLPLRSLADHQPLVTYLQKISRGYREKARAGGARTSR